MKNAAKAILLPQAFRNAYKALATIIFVLVQSLRMGIRVLVWKELKMYILVTVSVFVTLLVEGDWLRCSCSQIDITRKDVLEKEQVIIFWLKIPNTNCFFFFFKYTNKTFTIWLWSCINKVLNQFWFHVDFKLVFRVIQKRTALLRFLSCASLTQTHYCSHSVSAAYSFLNVCSCSFILWRVG